MKTGVEGDSVFVPDGQAILVDESTPELKLVVVDGVMVFDPRQKLIEFDATWFWIHGGVLRSEPISRDTTTRC